MCARAIMGSMFLACLVSAFASPLAAQAPQVHWGSDTRAMTHQECMKRAKFAIGEQGLQANTTTANETLGIGTNVAVLVTCVTLGPRMFISVVATSPDGNVAGKTRNGVRSIVMGPAN